MISWWKQRPHLSWALYDWANSAFVTTVMAGFFPLFFKNFWSQGTSNELSSARLAIAVSLSNALIAIAAPVLGAISDQAGNKKKFLFFFTALAIFCTAVLVFVPAGSWTTAMLVYALAVFGFGGAMVFYDALIFSVIGPKVSTERVSALAYSLGYLGGGILFAVNVLMYSKPQWFGLYTGAQGVLLSFASVAIWWALFSIPLFRYVPEPTNLAANTDQFRAPRWRAWIVEPILEVIRTLASARKFKTVFLFLAAFYLYGDGVSTIIRMAVDYGQNLGFGPEDLIRALLLTQFVGFPAALVFGKLADRYSPKRAILIGVAIYLFATVWAYQMDAVWEFYVLAAIIGLVQGGVQASSRSLFSELVPAQESAKFFGSYNLVGRFGGVLGPLLMTGATFLTGNPRSSVLSLSLLFLSGAVLLVLVPSPKK